MTTPKPADEEIAFAIDEAYHALKQMPTDICDLFDIDYEEYEECVLPVIDWARTIREQGA